MRKYVKTFHVLVCQDHFSSPMETNIPPKFFPFSLPAGNKCVFERGGPRGSSSNDSINIDIVRQDDSFPPLWKSREVRSHCVSPLFQQTNKVEVCRLNSAEAWAPVALTRCILGPSYVGLKLPGKVWWLPNFIYIPRDSDVSGWDLFNRKQWQYSSLYFTS